MNSNPVPGFGLHFVQPDVREEAPAELTDEKEGNLYRLESKVEKFKWEEKRKSFRNTGRKKILKKLFSRAIEKPEIHKNDDKVESIPKIFDRSVSADGTSVDSYYRKRRVSNLVDELLSKIYAENHCRKISSELSDMRDTTYYSSDSSDHMGKAILMRGTFAEGRMERWNESLKSRLMKKSIEVILNMKADLKSEINRKGSQLVRQLKKRDVLISKRDVQYDLITAFLQATSLKRREDTKIQFSVKPNGNENSFQQWQNAMKMVAKLPGGTPKEFRKTLWLSLSEKHISKESIDWSEIEKTCFNDSSNPDDEELGIQIVKDLHRTGCSMFCGASGEENQALLKRVLLAYARWNKNVGYCQGFNMLAALILQVMDKSESDSLKVMIYLIEGVLPESYFANNLRGLSVDMAVFRDLLTLKLPTLSRHLEHLQFECKESGTSYEPPLTNVFTMQWFLTLFSNCLPQNVVLRIWDLIFLEGNEILLKTALAVWSTLSNRILCVGSADEFYSTMGIIAGEMLEFGLMDVNLLVKRISEIKLEQLSELREKYTYSITPWTQVARKSLRFLYSDDESDNSDMDDKSSYKFFKTKHRKNSVRKILPAFSALGSSILEKNKVSTDISGLKKQYAKIREKQRQAHIIFTATYAAQEFVETIVPPIMAPAMNHLLLGNSKITYQNPPPLPSKEVARVMADNQSNVIERGQVTVRWEKMDKEGGDRDDEDKSWNSSTSTELCDDIDPEENDSCCSSPRRTFRSTCNLAAIRVEGEFPKKYQNTRHLIPNFPPVKNSRSSNSDEFLKTKSSSPEDLTKELIPKFVRKCASLEDLDRYFADSKHLMKKMEKEESRGESDLHINSDLISGSRAEKDVRKSVNIDAISEYSRKKCLLKLDDGEAFNPFPARLRAPKELGVKLGMYKNLNKKQ